MKSIKTVSSIVAILLMVGCSSQKANPKVGNQSDLAEVKEKMSKILFNHVDSDRSTKISEEEFVAYQKEKSELQERRQIERMIESCDKNGDKQISLDEIPQKDPTRPIPIDVMAYESYKEACYMNRDGFTHFDTNHDNIITFDEMATKKDVPMMPYPTVTPVPIPVPEDRIKEMERYITEKYSRCDKNSDGKLTLMEATSKICRIPSDEFLEADSNNNNFLTLQEVLDIAKKRVSEEQIIHHVPPIKIPPSAPKEVQLMMSMYKCDTNKDGKLSEAEITTESCGFSKEDLIANDHNKDGYFSQKDMAIVSMLRQFKRMDRNKDKVLDFSEFMRNGREIIY